MSNQNCLYQVSVYLKGDDLDPEELTIRFGVTPTQSHGKGKKWTTSTGKEVIEKTGLWAVTIKSESQAALSVQIENLTSQLLASGLAILDLPHIEEAYLDVFFAKDADDDGGGTCEFDLDRASIIALERLGIPVRFTVTIVRD